MNVRLMILLALCALASACNLDLQPLTAPPPGRVAEINPANGKIVMSQGVALAVQCTDGCDGVCVRPRFSVDNGEVLDVRPGFLGSSNDNLNASSVNDDTRIQILVAQTPGTSKLRVKSTCTDRNYTVTVLAEDPNDDQP